MIKGITPASAGKTKLSPSADRLSQDHPRECGKNSNMMAVTSWMWGSPPRVREKLKFIIQIQAEVGITPASAGKTLKDPIEIANPD